MKTRIALILLLFSMLFSGCSKVVLKADSDPNTDLSGIKSFYVRKLPADGRGIEAKIASQLNKFGYQATSGENEQPPLPVDAIVSYTDRWMWDITMYMLELNIQFRDSETDYVFASGNSYRTSLARKPPEYMIEEVLRKMLGMPPMVENKESEQEE
jgi:hypothetical protein